MLHLQLAQQAHDVVSTQLDQQPRDLRVRRVVEVCLHGLHRRDEPLLLHVWDAAAADWKPADVAAYQDGTLFASTPKQAFLIGGDSDLPTEIAEGSDWCKKVTHIPSLKVVDMANSMNGKLGTAAALFSLLDGYGKAVTHCSHRCAYAFNKTRTGHGGAWFNNYWTPIGAFHAGQEKFQHFMKGQQWWRELYRDHTGAVWQAHNAKGKASVLGVGFVAHRVAHHKRLRMYGAPRSAFGPNPPAYLKPALAAHRSTS